MIDNKFTLPVPYIVSAVFSDGTKHQQLLKAVRSHSDAEAAGGTIAQFYMEGGKLPLLLVHVMRIEESTARAAVAAFEEIAKANQEEAAKVSPFPLLRTPRPLPEQPMQMTSPYRYEPPAGLPHDQPPPPDQPA